MHLNPKTPLMVLVVCLMIGTLQAEQNLKSGTEEKSFTEVKIALEEAIEQRNFHNAKEILEELFPLIKKDIKKSKKHLATLKKVDDPEFNPEIFEANLDRKGDLYHSIKSISEATSAAFRVKADDLMAMVDEYHKLVDNS
jgi:predicted negative regulator of RcsB-dependent stress response